MTTPRTVRETSVFLTSRMNLSTRMATVWRRGKAKVNNLLNNTPPEACTMDEATLQPPFPLPYDIVEMIIAHLARDLTMLKACSLTCRAWYLASVPFLHHTLTLTEETSETARIRQDLRLSKLHELGLAHLVKEIRVKQLRGWTPWFVPRAFGHRDFPSFANVRALRLQELDLLSLFTPDIENCFKHFPPTLRSLTLFNSRCTPRQLSHFLSLFPNLDNIEIRNTYTLSPDPTIPDAELVPFSTPKFGGRLVLYYFNWVETWTHLIASCGNLRFRYLDLWWSATCAPILLETCAETLETLRVHTSYGPVGTHSVSSPEFNLSRLKVLRSLEIGDWLGNRHLGDHRRIIMEVFSTITSPVFSELVIVLTFAYDTSVHLLQEVEFLETLCKMNEVRPFGLVFLLEGPHVGRWEAGPVLKGNLDSAITQGLFDFLGKPPTIRMAQSSYYGWDLP